MKTKYLWMNKGFLIRIFEILFFSSFYLSGGAQPKKLDIDNIYDFSPQKLSRKEQKEKVKELDKFWNTIKSDTSFYLPQLRTELTTIGHFPYFYFDGSELLLKLSHSGNDKQIAANAIGKCDLMDIEPQSYVQTLNELAFDGIDVLQPALKILKYPDYKFYLVQHVMYFTQENCLAYCLLPMTSVAYTDSLISRFASADTTAQWSILYTLWLEYSCRGDSLIHASAKNKDLNAVIRALADTLVSHHPNPDPEQAQLTIDEIKEKRMDALRRFSDEGLADLNYYTFLLRSLAACGLGINKNNTP